MALINCPECGRQVSDQAQSCPQCGNPMATAPSEPVRHVPPVVQKNGRGCFAWFGLFAAVIVGIGIIALIVMPRGQQSSTSQPGATTTGPAAKAPDAPLPGLGGRSETTGWAITLDKIDTASEVGNQFTRKQAQGQFVLVTFTAQNKMNQTSQINTNDLVMKTADGTTFRGSSEGITAMLGEDPKPVFLIEQVQPGLLRQFRQVFDVNPQIKAYTVELAGTRFAVTLP